MIQVVSAGKPDEATLDNLMQLYLHDFSEIDGGLISADGRYEYPYLSTYFTTGDRYAYLIWSDESLAGFALIKTGSEIARDDQSMDVAEFFVLRSHRLKGVGRAAFGEIVRKFPGPWIVRVQEGYQAALDFWPRAISSVSTDFDSEVIDDGRRKWIVFRFEFAGSDSNGGIGSPSPASS